MLNNVALSFAVVALANAKRMYDGDGPSLSQLLYEVEREAKITLNPQERGEVMLAYMTKYEDKTDDLNR